DCVALQVRPVKDAPPGRVRRGPGPHAGPGKIDTAIAEAVKGLRAHGYSWAEVAPVSLAPDCPARGRRVGGGPPGGRMRSATPDHRPGACSRDSRRLREADENEAWRPQDMNPKIQQQASRQSWGRGSWREL